MAIPHRKKLSGGGEEMIYIKSGSSCYYEPIIGLLCCVAIE